MTPASVLYDDGIAAAATGHACPDCAESKQGYMDSLTPIEVADLTGYEYGEYLYRTGQPFEACYEEDERDGWMDAAADAGDGEVDAADAEFDGRMAAMDAYEAEGVPFDQIAWLFDDDYSPVTFNAYGDRVVGTDTGW